MNILIAIPCCPIPPPGPAYIASSLIKAGHNVKGYIFKSAKELISLIADTNPDLIMTGGLCSQYKEIKQILTIARNEGHRTVLGGGIVTSEPELMTNKLDADYYVIGQGEITVVS